MYKFISNVLQSKTLVNVELQFTIHHHSKCRGLNNLFLIFFFFAFVTIRCCHLITLCFLLLMHSCLWHIHLIFHMLDCIMNISPMLLNLYLYIFVLSYNRHDCHHHCHYCHYWYLSRVRPSMYHISGWMI